jgi:hypothetical protein
LFLFVTEVDFVVPAGTTIIVSSSPVPSSKTTSVVISANLTCTVAQLS